MNDVMVALDYILWHYWWVFLLWIIISTILQAGKPKPNPEDVNVFKICAIMIGTTLLIIIFALASVWMLR